MRKNFFFIRNASATHYEKFLSLHFRWLLLRILHIDFCRYAMSGWGVYVCILHPDFRPKVEKKLRFFDFWGRKSRILRCKTKISSKF